MTRVKICGITNAYDAKAACAAGADALGFVFVPSSPRSVGGDWEAARRLISEVPPLVWRVGLFETPPADLTLPELHAIQYYRGGASLGGASLLPIKAYRMRGEETLRDIADDPDPKALVLLDAYSATALGGTGHTFNWSLATRAQSLGLPIVLAGGLTPENVGAAIRQVRPYMVDVSSGVESAPGRKDPDKVRRFIRAVRETDAALAAGE